MIDHKNSWSISHRQD